MTDCTDALDILIEQEQQLITRFEARQAGADGIVTAIVTSAFTVAALITTAAQTIKNIDKTLPLVAVVALAVVLVVALCSRVFAGGHFSRSGDRRRRRRGSVARVRGSRPRGLPGGARINTGT